MSLFTSWFQQPGLQTVAGQAQEGGYQDPNQNMVNTLARVAAAMQQAGKLPPPPQIQQQAGQMLPPVTFQPSGMQGGQGGSVDFARGPSPGGWGGY